MNTPANIIARAWQHVQGWKFAEIGSVTWTNTRLRGGEWYPPTKTEQAKIVLGWEEGVDLVWHEAFHSVYHRCPLNSSKRGGWWTEGFCNAFSEVNRQHFYRVGISNFDIINATTNSHLRRYIIPCVLILSRCSFSAKGFRDLFFNLNQAANETDLDLDRYFDFCPETGLFHPESSYLTRVI